MQDILIDITTHLHKQFQFYSRMQDKDILIVIRKIIKCDYKVINDNLIELVDSIIKYQNNYKIFILSKEFLMVHNYFLCLQENVEIFYKDESDKVYNILIKYSKQEISNEDAIAISAENEGDPFEFSYPEFNSNEIYKLHNVKSMDEGDIYYNIKIANRIKETLTFKPLYDLKKFMANDRACTFFVVLKIIFFSKWFKA